MAALRNSSIPSSPSLCFQYEWKLMTSDDTRNSLILSNFFGIPGLCLAPEAFRLCAETDAENNLLQLSCYVNSVQLGLLGYRMAAVTFTQKGTNQFMELRNLGNREDNILFQWTSPSYVHPLMLFPPGCSFLSVRLYLTGSVEHYALHRFDGDHVHDLWRAAVYRQMTDVIFQVFDKNFPAHKFILAARSPVFRAMFDTDMIESRTGRVQIVDVEDPDVFEQFLRFLYTGQLLKPVTKQLGMVAEKYQVGTLTSICREALANEAAFHDRLLTIASFKELRDKQVLKDISRLGQEDQELEGIRLYADSCTIENAVQLVGKGCISCTHHKSIILKLESTNSDESTTTVAMYSSWAKEPALRLDGVDLLVFKKGVVWHRAVMEPFPLQKDSDNQPLQVFTASLRNAVFQDPKMSCRFLIHRSSTLEDYEYGLRDSLLAQELWSSAVDMERTDVEFHVSGKTFPAHRVVLIARCPALADLIPDEPSPLSPAIVQIDTMDPTTFENLLYFLYTGLIRKDSPDESLIEAAKSYRVNMLEQVGRESGGRQELNQDQISQALFLLG